MKKYKIQILSAIIVITILFVVVICFKNIFSKEKSYSLSSSITFLDKNGIMNILKDGYKLNYEDNKNEDGNLELKIQLEHDESRTIDYEVSALVNYNQQYFTTLESNKKVLSSIVSVPKNDSKEIVIIIDKSAFKLKQNHLVINIRQDIEQLSYKNSLVRNMSSINYTFYVNMKDGEKVNIQQKNIYKNLIQSSLNDINGNVVFNISTANNDSPLIKINKNEAIPINIEVGGNEKRQYIIWAYLNSKQVKIDDHTYLNVDINGNMVGKANVKIENNVEPGIYELELFCVPSPFEIDYMNLKEIFSSQRYTLKVE